jgi:regulatory protein
MKIEKIARKNNRDVTVYLDTGEELFLAREIIEKNGLRKNDELTEEDKLSLIEQNKLYFIKQSAFRYLGKRIHSSYEIRTKLKQKKYEEALIDSVISDLIKNNYLDDRGFTERFTEEKINTKSWGKIKIEAELRKRKIPAEIISQTLESRFGGVKEIESAKELALKKMKILAARGYNQKKIKEKLFAILYSRGYDYETIKETVDLLLKES